MAFVPAVPVVPPPPAITEARSVAGQRVHEGEQPQFATAHLENSSILQIKLPQTEKREQLMTAVRQAFVMKETQLVASQNAPPPKPVPASGVSGILPDQSLTINITTQGSEG